MDLHSTHPYWLLKNGLQQPYPPLESDISSEVVIIGGGITGALLAHHFGKAGIDTVLLDKREVAWGSTSASTALLQYEIDVPLHKLRETYGKEFADRAYRSCADAISKIESLLAELGKDCGFQRKPSIYMAEKEGDVEELRREFAARKEAGFEVEWLDEEALRDATGITRPAAIRSACGAQVDAFLLAHACFASAVDAGVRVLDRTGVEHCKFYPSCVDVITDRGYTVRCKRVVFATGYEVNDFLKRDIVNLNSSFAVATEPMPGAWPKWESDALIWEMAQPYLYIRSTDDHRIIVGGEDAPYKNAIARDNALPGKAVILIEKLKKLIPQINPEIAYAWAGTFGETEDGLAYIGEVEEQPRAHYALGFGGNGITYSILAAEIIRDSLQGKIHEYADLFSFDRKQK